MSFIAQHGSWLLASLTLIMMIALGLEKRWGWMLGLWSQLAWAVWVYATQNWGFIPLTGALTIVYYLNWKRWSTKMPEDLTLGWVVGNAQANMFRAWQDGPCWTTDPNEALHFVRRKDADEFCADDEDAWRIIRHRIPVTSAEVEHRRIAGVLPLSTN